jgi:hypothetical protein
MKSDKTPFSWKLDSGIKQKLYVDTPKLILCQTKYIAATY